MLAARDLARSAVLLTPAPPAGILMVHKPSVIKTFWKMQTQWGFWRKPVRLGFKESVYSTLHLLDPEEQRETYDELVWESGRAVWEIGYWFLDGGGAARVDEDPVTCPVLVIGGGKDRMVPASVVRRVADKYDDVAAYREYPSHAHWIVEEPGWEEVAADVVEWLEGSSAAAA
jgi:pimeloyl-ACP methyl ester carboxylesterase